MTACGSLCPCITALGCLTLAKAAWRRLRPPFVPFSSLEPPLPAYTGFIQMRAAKSTSVGYYTVSGYRIPVQMYTISRWPNETAQPDIAPRGLATRRENYLQTWVEKDSPIGSRKKLDYHSPGELIE